MMSAWVAFAGRANPNASGLPQWPAYDPGVDNHLAFGDVVASGQRWRQRQRQLDFLQRFFSAR